MQKPEDADVIVPVYGAAAELARCLESVVAHTDLSRHRLLLVIDGPQDAAVEALVARFETLRNERRLGFAGSVNRGMRATSRDIVLLNSDTVVTARWLEKLREAAYSAERIATVTPLSNNATICSVPIPAGHDVDSFAAHVERVSAREYPRIPTAVGFCMYIRRAALEDVGFFDDVQFAGGYGEENDFCMRALGRGWMHVADDATFIYHVGHASFGVSRFARQRRAARVLSRLHPQYDALIAESMRVDPLAAVRGRIWSAEAAPPLSHSRGYESGGVASALHRVIRGEGVVSAFVRARERISESFERFDASDAAIVNVGDIASRNGGVAVQLRARLGVERRLRAVAVARSLDGLKPVHVEGTSGVSLDQLRRVIDSGVGVIVSVHDFSIHRRKDALAGAKAVIFPSHFLLEQHACGGVVIEPASAAKAVEPTNGRGIAFAGSVKPHKGGLLLPEIASLLATRGQTLHVFGGGDMNLLRALRRHANVRIHGYYRSATLPSLLARHGIGLVLIPSIVPEAFCMTVSEAWLAGASVAAFEHGAQAERIREHGGGWLAPLEAGAAGLVEIVDRWLGGESVRIPQNLATPETAARAHLQLYRELGVLP